MNNLASNRNVDQIGILESGHGVQQLLGVPKIISGTGKAQAEAVVTGQYS